MKQRDHRRGARLEVGRLRAYGFTPTAAARTDAGARGFLLAEQQAMSIEEVREREPLMPPPDLKRKSAPIPDSCWQRCDIINSRSRARPGDPERVRPTTFAVIVNTWLVEVRRSPNA